MKIGLLVSLLVASICWAAATSDPRSIPPPDDDAANTQDTAKDAGSNELARRRKRHHNFGSSRQCCPTVPTSCCPCCHGGGGDRSTTTDTPVEVTVPSVDPLVYVGSENFTDTCINSADFWIVIFTFSGPGCTACAKVVPLIREILVLIRDHPDIRIAIFDANYGDHKTFLMKRLGITIFPYVYLYCLDKEHPYDFGQPRPSQEIVISIIYLITRPRLAVGRCGDESDSFPSSSVYELSDVNFEETIISCSRPIVINFYLAYPDVCQNFFRVFDDAADNLGGRVLFGSFYQTGKSSTLQKYGVTDKACWVKMWPRGGGDSCVIDFNQGTHSPSMDRTLQDWVLKYLNGDNVQGVCDGVMTVTPTTDSGEKEDDKTTTRWWPPSRTRTTTRRTVPTTKTTTKRTTTKTTTKKPTTTTRRTTTKTTTRRTTTKTTTKKPTTTTRRTTTKTTTKKPTTTTRRTTTKRLTTTTKKPTTTTRRTTTKTTTKKPTTTTRRTTTKTTTRRTTTKTTTKRPTTTTRKITRTRTPTTMIPWWQTTTPRKITPTKTRKTPPPGVITRTTSSADSLTADPSTEPEPLPTDPEINEDWCKYQCCIVYFLPAKTNCAITCYKNYMISLRRVAQRHNSGCGLYIEYQGKRPDFEATFALFHFPKILIVNTATRQYVTRDGTVSDPELDKYFEAYIQGKLKMKKIPIYVPPACEGEAC